MRLLLVTLYFPPAGGGGVQRALKMASHLPALGIETHVLAPDDPKWIHEDAELEVPTQAWVHRARYVGPKGRRPAEELHGRQGLELRVKQAQLLSRRLLVPDENVSWNLTAIPAAIRIVRDEEIDVVLTTSPPGSVHLIGAAVKRATGVKWVADLRDSLGAHAHRRADTLLTRVKEGGRQGVARLVARSADAIVTVSDALADEVRALEPKGRVESIANGSDFDEEIDVVLTTSPPGSVHLIGAAVKRATGVKWVADLRDSLGAHAHRRADTLLTRVKEGGRQGVARLVARSADAIVTVSDALADEVRALEPKGRVESIPNGSDFDDFAGLDYRPDGERFRITHTGSFFGKRDPRPFLRALAQADPAVVARFVGDFRTSDREFAESLDLEPGRLELHPYVPRRRSLELQRDSEALLLLIPDAGGRGKGVLSGKVFEYLAAERPILAAVPPDGAAAGLIRETGAGVVAPAHDVEALGQALAALVERWRAGTLDGTRLSPADRHRVSRAARMEELADLLRAL